MSKVYTLYIRGEAYGPASSESVVCESRLQLVAEAKAALARYPDCERVDVYLGDEELFMVAQTRETD